MRAHGFTAEAILAALMAENAGRCAPPLGADEVAQIAASAARYEPGAARRGDAGRAGQLSFHTADEIASFPGAKVRWIVASLGSGAVDHRSHRQGKGGGEDHVFASSRGVYFAR